MEIRRRATAGGWLVELSGIINDELGANVAFSDLNGVVVFDLKGVRRITSFGVAHWIAALRGLRAETYLFINCSPVIVNGFNCVKGFGCKGTVVSVIAPFACSCSHEFLGEIDLRRSSGDESAPCPKCGQGATLDDEPDSYFHYTRKQGKPRLSREADEVLTALMQRR